MSDALIQGNSSSSLVRALSASNVDTGLWKQDLKASAPPGAVEIVSLQGSAVDMTLGGESTCTLSKLGLGLTLWVRLDISGFEIVTAAGGGSTKVVLSKALGIAMIETATLCTHSRELAKLDSRTIARHIDQLDSGERDIVQSSLGWNWFENNAVVQPSELVSGTASGAATWSKDVFGNSSTFPDATKQNKLSVLVPLYFSCFKNNPHHVLLQSFGETVQLKVRLRPKASYMSGDGGTTAVNVTVLQKMMQLAPDVYRKMIRSQFSENSSLQQLWCVPRLIGSASAAFDGTERLITTFNIATNAADMCKSISVYAYYGHGKHNVDLLEIASCKMSAGGRDIFNLSGTEARSVMTAAGLKGLPARLGTTAEPHYTDGSSNYFHYSFALAGDDDSSYSLGASLAGLSAQQFEIKVVTRAADHTDSSDEKIHVEIYSNSIQVLSCSANDGRYSKAISY